MENINLNNQDPLKIPEAMMIRPKIAAVFDNIKDTIDIMTVVYPEKNIKAEVALDLARKRIKLNIQKLNSQIQKNKTITINNVQIITLRDTTHLFPFEVPEKTGDIILDFVKHF